MFTSAHFVLSPLELNSTIFIHSPHLSFHLDCRIAIEKLKPVNGLYKVKKWVEDRGLKRAAVTNAPKENAELMISMLGLSDFFQAVILGSDCEHAKPFPDPYLKALEVLKVSKEHTFVFDVSFLHAFSPLLAFAMADTYTRPCG